MKNWIALFGFLFLFSCQQGPGPAVQLEGYTSEPVPGSPLERVYKGIPGDIDEEGFVLNGQKTGLWVTYHQEKKHMPQKVVSYAGGKITGLYAEYSDRGQLEVIAHYRENTLHGRYAKYKYGRIIEEKYYKNGVLDGYYREFFPNTDKVQKEVQFKDGKENGSYRFYNEEGKVIVEYVYRDGEKVSGGIVESGQ